MLRIGYNDVVRGHPLELTTLDLSNLADACVEAATRSARESTVARHGEPIGDDGAPARFVVLAMGKLGGQELNYSSDIDLIFVYDHEGRTGGPKAVTNAEFFARMGGAIVRLLSDHTAMGQAFRVDMRFRPEGDQGPLARSLRTTLDYYVNSGRTWERQALIKCRPIAGDPGLGADFLAAIAPYIYRRYLGAAEIADIKAMKRRIEARTHAAGDDEREVKTGRGGIRDVEFVVQFLQLLHGGGEPIVRHANTLMAISRLEEIGCLSPEERGIMEDTYRFLRRVEHRLQIMFDRQTHQMPVDLEGLRTLAIRMGYPPSSPWEDRVGPAERFGADYRAKAELNRKILNHLLHDAFTDDGGVAPVVDHVLDPEPSPEAIAGDVLGRGGFRDVGTAYKNLLALAREDIEFLSQARCRQFLAAIAPRLLEAISKTPDPDMTLTNLEKVSASLGAKAILWELFSFNPPSLRLFVDLCATSQFLCEVLINNPGMIDDLMDSLVVDRAQGSSAIKGELAELCRGAEDLAPILASFRNKEWVRIGVRDILGREPIRDVTRELADVAEAVVAEVARDEWARRIAKCGVPRRASDGRRARWAILGLGKLGGREMNYHSDVDLVFLYDQDGRTDGCDGWASNDKFFADLAQRVIRDLGGSAEFGPLYHVDTRLRPYGGSGPLAVTLDAFVAYFSGPAATWERLALTRARPLFRTGTFGREVAAAIRDVLTRPTADRSQVAAEVVAMRRKMGDARGRKELKCGAGGIVDIEFLAQFLQLVNAPAEPDVLSPNIWDALDSLRRAGKLARDEHDDLRDAYGFLRAVEGAACGSATTAPTWACPRITRNSSRLARNLGYEPDDARDVGTLFRSDIERLARRTRSLFEQIVGPIHEGSLHEPGQDARLCPPRLLAAFGLSAWRFGMNRREIRAVLADRPDPVGFLLGALGFYLVRAAVLLLPMVLARPRRRPPIHDPRRPAAGLHRGVVRLRDPRRGLRERGQGGVPLPRAARGQAQGDRVGGRELPRRPDRPVPDRGPRRHHRPRATRPGRAEPRPRGLGRGRPLDPRPGKRGHPAASAQGRALIAITIGLVAVSIRMGRGTHSLNVLAFFQTSIALFGAASVPGLAEHFLIVPLVLFTTAVPLPFGALGVSEQASRGLFGLMHYDGGAVAMLGFRVVMIAGAGDRGRRLHAQRPGSPQAGGVQVTADLQGGSDAAGVASHRRSGHAAPWRMRRLRRLTHPTAQGRSDEETVTAWALHFAQNVSRLVLRLVIGPHDHLGQHAHQDALHPCEEEHHREHGQRGGHEILRRLVEVLEEEHQAEGQEAQEHRPQPDPAEQVDGPLGLLLEEADQDQVEDDVEGPAQPVFRLAGGAGPVVHLGLDHAGALPCGEDRDESVHLAVELHAFEHAAAIRLHRAAEIV